MTTTTEPSVSRDLATRWKLNSTKMVKSLAALLLVSLIFFTLFSIFISPSSDGLFSKLLDPQALKNILNQNQTQKDFKSPHSVPEKKPDKLLGGLLLAGLDESSCQSRYQSNLYRMTRPPRQPSSHLISRLRSHEALQKRCGPNTDAYNKSVVKMSSGENTNTDCKYMIWTPFEGLGNRMLSLASTFLYALLTNRVLLIGEGDSMPDLFCEPFPDASWLLPSDFPINQFKNFNKFSPNSYGKLSKNNSINKNPKLMPPYVYIHMVFDFDRTEKLSFCDQDQTLLHNVPFLILKSNLYYIPSIFSIPSFQQELDNLFPEKETVFHHLGRYLFHPTNSVWGLITRYYDAYLAKADEKLGIQVRVFNGGRNAFPNLDQILSCTIKENLLPETNNTEIVVLPKIIEKGEKGKTKAVLITSLMPSYYEEIRKKYWEHTTISGENIAVYQPSHEETQQTGNQMHDRKALAEIYLLSMTDKLVTSARSTFGYVAQSLGGLRPWILYSMPNPPCKQAFSMEPCYQFAPIVYTCKNEKGIETASLLPDHLRECEDMIPSMMLFDNNT